MFSEDLRPIVIASFLYLHTFLHCFKNRKSIFSLLIKAGNYIPICLHDRQYRKSETFSVAFKSIWKRKIYFVLSFGTTIVFTDHILSAKIDTVNNKDKMSIKR